MDRVVDDDSPYGKGSSFLLNDRPSVVDVNDDDVNPSVSAQGSVLGSWGNKKWGYTASYVAKKEGEKLTVLQEGVELILRQLKTFPFPSDIVRDQEDNFYILVHVKS
ncbi:hypothetical protein HanPI659440_Chr16g0649161 [Helianthus annuus]|nr:hypothetical protein HanPI659440_Chr16g0649161 [Helianthus annuus]